jgi:hypothetical protein
VVDKHLEDVAASHPLHPPFLYHSFTLLLPCLPRAFMQLWWSAATALTPLAAEAGLPVLLAVRALMGLGEGVAMPAMNCMLSR